MSWHFGFNIAVRHASQVYNNIYIYIYVSQIHHYMSVRYMSGTCVSQSGTCQSGTCQSDICQSDTLNFSHFVQNGRTRRTAKSSVDNIKNGREMLIMTKTDTIVHFTQDKKAAYTTATKTIPKACAKFNNHSHCSSLQSSWQYWRSHWPVPQSWRTQRF